MRRKVLVALLGTLSLLVLCSTASAATKRLVYTPFASDGQIRADLNVVDRDGECFTASWTVSGTYRCITGNLLRDPCYVDRTVDEEVFYPVVVCASDPWRRTVVRIALEDELPEPSSFRSTRPWAIKLASGRRCVFMTGATNIVGGYRLNYACGDNRYLYGSPRTSSSTWKIRYSRGYEGRGMKFVGISSVSR